MIASSGLCVTEMLNAMSVSLSRLMALSMGTTAFKPHSTITSREPSSRYTFFKRARWARPSAKRELAVQNGDIPMTTLSAFVAAVALILSLPGPANALLAASGALLCAAPSG
jgi:hypothetical protein